MIKDHEMGKLSRIIQGEPSVIIMVLIREASGLESKKQCEDEHRERN